MCMWMTSLLEPHPPNGGANATSRSAGRLGRISWHLIPEIWMFALGPHRELESVVAVMEQHHRTHRREDEKVHQQLMIYSIQLMCQWQHSNIGFIYAALAANLPKASSSPPYEDSRPPPSQLASVQGNAGLTAPATQGLHWQSLPDSPVCASPVQSSPVQSSPTTSAGRSMESPVL
ncbi:hypothetical protein TgHK011_009147 [Trichoderma gracile]|nr:hypothetical protein TgHK011_009147 [Trichoderma gracile]